MPVQNLNNGLLNGIGGSYGTPTGLNPVYPNISHLDYTKKAVTFCDFFGSLGDFSASFTPQFNDITTSTFDSRTVAPGTGGVWIQTASYPATLSLGIRRGTSAGSQGGASFVRPFVFETVYEMLAESTSTNTFVMYFGIDNQIGTYPTHSNFNGCGVWFEYTNSVNSGNWQLKASLFDANYNFINVTIDTPFSAYNSQAQRKLRIEKDIWGSMHGVYRGYIDNILIGQIPLSIGQFVDPAIIGEARVIMRKTTGTGATNRVKLDYLLYETDAIR